MKTPLVEAMALLCLAAMLASAQMPFTQSFTFGMVGVTADQIARLNVVNAAVGPTVQTNCTIDLNFLDSDGKAIRSARLSLDPQKSAVLDLARSDMANAQGRVEIRALFSETVASTEGIMSPGSACAPVATLEVFDRDSLRTTFILTNPSAVPLGTAPAPGLAIRQSAP